MSKIIIWVLLLQLLHPDLSGQESSSVLPASHKDVSVAIRQNLSYNRVPVQGVHSKYHLFDWYEGGGPKEPLRPLVILMHGGGFRLGNKATDSTPFIAKAFARNGYSCASINYRRSRKRPLARFEDLAEGCFDALEDLQLAIRYFKQNWAEYSIDTNRIILAGNSAGGMMALHAVYPSRYELGLFTKKDNPSGLSKSYNPENIYAVINYWGAIYDTVWLKNTKVPVMNIHGGKDRVVPNAENKGPLYGSEIIHRNAVFLGIPTEILVYKEFGHELHRHFNPLGAGGKARKRWREATVQAVAFLNGLTRSAQ